MPVILPDNSGSTLETAFAAPVVVGMTFPSTALPARRSRLLYPSSTCCDRVEAWTVVMRAWIIPNLSFKSFAKGARQLVVQLAHDTTVGGLSVGYCAVLTPYTKVGASLLGAEIITLFAPACLTCRFASAVDVNLPVLSMMYWAPETAQSSSLGSRSEVKWTSWPQTDKVFAFMAKMSFDLIFVLLLSGPCVESKRIWWITSSIEAQVWLIATTRSSFREREFLNVIRPFQLVRYFAVLN